jgi:hypothetical protein
MINVHEAKPNFSKLLKQAPTLARAHRCMLSSAEYLFVDSFCQSKTKCVNVQVQGSFAAGWLAYRHPCQRFALHLTVQRA